MSGQRRFSALSAAAGLAAEGQELAGRMGELEILFENAPGLFATRAQGEARHYSDAPRDRLLGLEERLFRGLGEAVRREAARAEARGEALSGVWEPLSRAYRPEEELLPEDDCRLEHRPSFFPRRETPAGDILVAGQGEALVVSEPHARGVHVHSPDGGLLASRTLDAGLPFGLFEDGGAGFFVCDVTGRRVLRMDLDARVLESFELERIFPASEPCRIPYFGAFAGGEVVLRTTDGSQEGMAVLAFDPKDPAGTWRRLDTGSMGPANHMLLHGGEILLGETGTGALLRYDAAAGRFVFHRRTGMGAGLYRFGLCGGALYSLTADRVTKTGALGQPLFATSLARHFAAEGDVAQAIAVHSGGGRATLFVAGNAVHAFDIEY